MSKRIISLVLAVVLVFSLMSTGVLAATGTGTASKYDASVQKMNSFGVILGYGNGDLGGNDDITRAQFAAAAVRALGYEAAAKAASGSTSFSDVAANHWSAGYVNVATQLGVIKGMGDGTFAPDQKVTMIQALAMIERAMGYQVLADEKGGWPTGYMVVAQDRSLDLNLTKDITESPSMPAPRGLVCKILDNALTAPFYSILGYDSKGIATYGKNVDVTLLVKMGYLQAKDVMVTLTPAYGADAGKVKISNAVTKASETDYKIGSVQNIENFMGQRVTAYYKMDNDERVLVELNKDAKSTLIAASNIKEMSASSATQLKIKNTSDVETTYDMINATDSVVGAVYNYNTVAASNDFTTMIGAGQEFGDQNDLREANVSLYDGKVDFIYGFKYEPAAKVDSTIDNTVTGALKIRTDAGTYFINKDKDNKAKFYSINKDGAAATTANVLEDDIIYVAAKNAATVEANAKDNMMKFFVTGKKVSGEMKSAILNGSDEATKLKIDATSYEMKTPATLASMNGGEGITYGDKIVVTLTKDGKIYDVEKDSASNTTGYAVILNMGKETNTYGVATYSVKLFKADGTKVEYFLDKDSAAETAAAATMADVSAAGVLTKGDLVKYELNKDSKIVTLDKTLDGSNANTAVNVDRKKINNLLPTSDAVMFNVADAKSAANGTVFADTDDADVSLVNWSMLTNKDGAPGYDLGYKLNSDANRIAAVVFNNSVQTDSSYAVVTENSRISATENHLKLLTKNGAVEYDTVATIAQTLVAGDVISYTLDGSNKVDSVAVQTAVNATVEEISELTADSVKIDTGIYAFADSVTVFYNENLDNSKDFTSMTKADLLKYQTVKLYVDGDNNVVAVAVAQK